MEFSETQSVESDDRISGREGYGLVQVFTGDGKGKTTAALGEVMRTVGAGKRTAIIFFDKGGDHYSERKIFDEKFPGQVDWWMFGRDRIDPDTGAFDFSLSDVDVDMCLEGIEKAHDVLDSNQYDLVVLDELNTVIHLGICSVEEALDLLLKKPEHTELVITGRNAPKELIEKAHLVTEMRLKKHYFYSGVPAREGLDY